MSLKPVGFSFAKKNNHPEILISTYNHDNAIRNNLTSFSYNQFICRSKNVDVEGTTNPSKPPEFNPGFNLFRVT